MVIGAVVVAVCCAAFFIFTVDNYSRRRRAHNGDDGNDGDSEDGGDNVVIGQVGTITNHDLSGRSIRMKVPPEVSQPPHQPTRHTSPHPPSSESEMESFYEKYFRNGLN